MDKFDVFFSGKILPDKDAIEVKASVGHFFKVEGKTLEQLFSGKSIKVKKSIDVDTAGKYREAFRKMGALVDISIAKSAENIASSKPTSTATSDTPNQKNMSASQASLEDCTTEVIPTPIPDIDSYNLDALGITLDNSPEFEAQYFDTSGLNVSEANTGSLEDCIIEKEIIEIPDISQMSLSSNDL